MWSRGWMMPRFEDASVIAAWRKTFCGSGSSYSTTDRRSSPGGGLWVEHEDWQEGEGEGEGEGAGEDERGNGRDVNGVGVPRENDSREPPSDSRSLASLVVCDRRKCKPACATCFVCPASIASRSGNG